MSAGLTAAINKGISAAEKLHTIRVSVNADTSQITEQLEGRFC